ncbi:MAG: methyl-accepting chemotaxis protein, partial [Pseudomonadota bacterium]
HHGEAAPLISGTSSFYCSGEIANIIGVIDEIAFQTNLLALNAAVEAARAGDQGRGFAVVASEVRGLAQRSAEAAKEIKSLINDTTNRVKEGSRLVNESGVTLDTIVESVSEVRTLVEDVARANEEQADGVEQINRVIAQLDQMTQQNASLMENSKAASEANHTEAARLVAAVETIRTNGAAQGQAPGQRSVNAQRRTGEGYRRTG